MNQFLWMVKKMTCFKNLGKQSKSIYLTMEKLLSKYKKLNKQFKILIILWFPLKELILSEKELMA